METKTYTYQEPFFTMEVKVEGAFCAFLTVLLTWNAATNLFGMGFLFAIFAAVALYQTWNTFIARCYAHSVTIGEDEISFELFGKSQSYKLSELKEFQIRGGSRGCTSALATTTPCMAGSGSQPTSTRMVRSSLSVS